MSVILYGRVSTEAQSERDLSIPAQLRALHRLAADRGWAVAAEYRDVGTGRSLKERPGLVAAVNHAIRDRLVEAVMVHRVDRLARNVYTYLTLKTKLRQHGVRIVSYVEHFEANPMGEFLEHVMAAQAEFYSANLSLEVKKGMEERLRRGKWTGMAPVGYEHAPDGRIIMDPARAPLIRRAFDLWTTGEITTQALADRLHAEGLVGRKGSKLRASHLCRILHNTFYAGTLVVKGHRYPGIHPPLVSERMFSRAQEIFRLKNGVDGGRPLRRLTFLLARKIVCPMCGATMIGEEHLKPSGRLYRYYRCHRAMCRGRARADEIESAVIRHLMDLRITETAVPILRRRIKEAMNKEGRATASQLRHLDSQRKDIDHRRRETAASFAEGRMDETAYERVTEELHHAARVTDLLSIEASRGGDVTRGDRGLLEIAASADRVLLDGDTVSKRRVIESVVSRVRLEGSRVAVEVTAPWTFLLAQSGLTTTDTPISQLRQSS